MYDDFETYNDDSVHNMWVDYTASQYDDEEDSPCCDDNNCQGMSVMADRPSPTQNSGQSLTTSRRESKLRIESLRSILCGREFRLANLQYTLDRLTSSRKIKNQQQRIAQTQAEIKELKQKLADEQQNFKNITARNIKLLTLAIACLGIVVVLILWVL